MAEKNEKTEKDDKKKKYYRELEDLPGIGDASAEKLRKAGYSDFKTIAAASPHELAEAAEIGVENAKRQLPVQRKQLKSVLKPQILFLSAGNL